MIYLTDTGSKKESKIYKVTDLSTFLSTKDRTEELTLVVIPGLYDGFYSKELAEFMISNSFYFIHKGRIIEPFHSETAKIVKNHSDDFFKLGENGKIVYHQVEITLNIYDYIIKNFEKSKNKSFWISALLNGGCPGGKQKLTKKLLINEERVLKWVKDGADDNICELIDNPSDHFVYEWIKSGCKINQYMYKSSVLDNHDILKTALSNVKRNYELGDVCKELYAHIRKFPDIVEWLCEAYPWLIKVFISLGYINDETLPYFIEKNWRCIAELCNNYSVAEIWNVKDKEYLNNLKLAALISLERDLL